MSILSLTKKIFSRQRKQPNSRSLKDTAVTKPTVREQAVVNRSSVTLELLVTEKGMDEQSAHQVATFRVPRFASKGQIAAAIREHYRTEPLSIRTTLVRPKTRRRGAQVGKTRSWKKAYVAVKDVSSLVTKP